ncbi:MAG: hypothetical protein MAG794_01427 [Gammaproteobacteria bacterium]|nr:hypothetical protein [Gammaproteobacteria bacterium]
MQAGTRYVTDELTITLRSGQDSSHRVVKTLPSGTPVEVLSENKETGYSQVKAPDGAVGYSLTRYLISKPPAQVRVVELEKDLERLKSKPDDRQKKLAELQGKYQTLRLKYDSLEFKNVQLSQRMGAINENAVNVVALMDERDTAQLRANRLAAEVDELRVENTGLENHSDKKWFMAGAGVLVLGVLIGIIVPKISVRRRSGWGSSDFSL